MKIRHLILSVLPDVRRIADYFVILFSAVLSLTLVGGSISTPGFLMVIFLGSGGQFLCLFPIMRRERYWRNVSAYEAIRFARNALFSGMVFLAIALVFFNSSLITSWIFVNMLTSVSGLCGMRLVRRMLHEIRGKRMNRLGRPTLIYGSGSIARSLALRFASDPSLGIRVVGYINQDSSQVGRIENGIQVLGTEADIPQLLKSHGIQQLIFAESINDGTKLKTILQEAYLLKVQTKMVTDLGLKAGKEEGANLFRDLNLQDLLQRPKVEVDLKSTFDLVNNKVVLVSGAGGSIGSELIRQIAKMNPSKIIALDHSEFNLYEIESEMKRSGRDGLLVPVLSDLKEPRLVSRMLEEYRPQCIFHAAAYKHVHLVETNPNAAIINNLFTLKNLIDSSVKHTVDCFVLISTDKAVNPKGVMGCTKRAGELMISEAAVKSGKRYCSVRFGNVLGSSGSFIPLLKKQILEGGPVTITHPEMERYFMLIPEAVSLVLKAASISSPGDINVLRMGDSIKILEVAKSLMILLGTSEQMVPIIFTGIRPGEKLREELYLRGDELRTLHPDILVLPRGAQVTKEWNHRKTPVSALVEEIIAMARNDDSNASVLLRSMVESSDQEALAERIEISVANNERNPNLVA